MNPLVAALLLQASGVWLENDYVRVSRNSAPCGPGALSSVVPWCGDRVIVALGDMELVSRGVARKMVRGNIAVFTRGEGHNPPAGNAQYFEVAFKPNPPPVLSPRELVPPDKNVTLHDGEKFFVFEERLSPNETRARHGHSQRVVIQLNRTRLQQWPDNEPEVIRDIQPDTVGFNPPVIHTVKNIGALPLRGIVIEFKPQRNFAPVNSAAIATAIIKSALPRLRAVAGNGVKVEISTAALARDPGSRLHQSLRNELRSHAPELLSDSTSRYSVVLRLTGVQVKVDSLIVSGSLDSCVPPPPNESMYFNRASEVFTHVMLYRNNAWQSGPIRITAVGDGRC